MEKVSEIANLYVATLRGLYLFHQHCHWTTAGLGFYGDHLLFERLYKSAQENADLAAEKFIGLFGKSGIDYSLQAKYLNKLLLKYSDIDHQKPAKLALAFEKDFLAFSDQTYQDFEKADVMTMGLDDMIMAIASKREEACYLLQQSFVGFEGE